MAESEKSNADKQIKSPSEDIGVHRKVNETVIDIHDHAGPSGSYSLPGTVESIHRTRKSKSEHNITQVITSKHVTDALTSIKFTKNKEDIPNLKVDVPIPAKQAETINSTTLLDLKKFMTSCFKLSETANITAMTEVPNITEVATEVVQGCPNSDVVTNNVQAENVTNVNNEVIVTNTTSTEPKLSKISDSHKKKTSGNLSERSDFGLAQRDSLSSIGSNVCRICMTRGRERLISPCNCKGSLANVHLSCLERWLNQVGRNHCELCGYSYPAIRTPRYTVLQALRLWFGNPRNRSHLQSDCLIFWLLSTVTAGLLAVCIVGTQYFVIEGNKFGISHRVTETAMDFFMAILLCGYSVTVYLLWKDHYIMWNRWRRANVNVRLLLTPDTNPVPFVPRRRYNNV